MRRGHEETPDFPLHWRRLFLFPPHVFIVDGGKRASSRTKVTAGKRGPYQRDDPAVTVLVLDEPMVTIITTFFLIITGILCVRR